MRDGEDMSTRLVLRRCVVLGLLLFWRLSHAEGACVPEEGCTRITAIGHGAIAEDNDKTMIQRQLLAMRAAKVDALRSLAEQVQGLRIQSESISDGYAKLSDRTQTGFDTVLKGIRYLSVEPVQPGIYQALVEMDVRQ